MNYEIIKDKDKLLEFIEWLPELQINERYYLALFARKKYCADVKYIKTDKAQVHRTLSQKKDLYNKIAQLECPINTYEIKNITIPQEALALYISMNPRDLEKGTRMSLIKFANLLALKYNGYNPIAEVMSEVHKTVSRKIYFDFDFDEVDYEPVIEKFKEYVNEDAITSIKTKNGFHILLELKKVSKEFEKTWYKNIATIEGCDVKGDNLIPVVGCTQGNYTPYFIK